MTYQELCATLKKEAGFRKRADEYTSLSHPAPRINGRLARMYQAEAAPYVQARDRMRANGKWLS